MAKLGENVFGGFSGKLGNVVGYSWKGIWCVRVRPQTVRNPRTEAQQRHRTMFAEEVRLAGRMGWAVGVGFKTLANEHHMTPQNAFVSINQQSFSMVDGAFEVDWRALTVSAGPVAPVRLGAPEVDEHNVLTVRFAPHDCAASLPPNPRGMKADRFDSVYIYVYSPELERGYLAAPVYRMDKRVRVALPDMFAGRELHVYGFAVDKEGNASFSSYAEEEEDLTPQTTPMERVGESAAACLADGTGTKYGMDDWGSAETGGKGRAPDD